MKTSLFLSLFISFVLSLAFAQQSKLTCKMTPANATVCPTVTPTPSQTEAGVTDAECADCKKSQSPTLEKTQATSSEIGSKTGAPLCSSPGAKVTSATTSKNDGVTGLTDDFIRAYMKVYGAGNNNLDNPEVLKQYIAGYQNYMGQLDKQIETIKQQIQVLDDPDKQAELQKKKDAIQQVQKDMNDIANQYTQAQSQGKADLAQELYTKYQAASQNYYKMINDMNGGGYNYANYSKDQLNQYITQLNSQRDSYATMIKQYQDKLATLEKSKTETKPSAPDAVSDSDRKIVTNAIHQYIDMMKSRSQYSDCGLTDVELFGIIMYSGDAYTSINAALRSGDAEQIKRYQFIIDVINSGLNKIANYEGTVNRGLSLDANSLKEYCEGCTVTMKAFTSTSTQAGFGGSQRFIIKSKTGAYIAPLSLHAGEEEVLFKSNTKFKILAVNGNEYTMEEVADQK